MEKKNTLKRIYSILAILFFTAIHLNAQTSSRDEIYRTYDQIVGLENTGLYNGTEFTDLYLNTDGTFRYLMGFDYIKGSVMYKGQYYVDVLLKYDLLEDNLITQSNDNLSIFNVKLIPEFVSEFSLHNLHFVKLSGIDKNGFFEYAFNGDSIDLYIKRASRKREKVLKSGIQYSFKQSNYYLMAYNAKFNKVETIKDVTRAFPEIKSEIKAFHQSFRSVYKRDRDVFMKNLTAYLDSLLKSEKL